MNVVILIRHPAGFVSSIKRLNYYFPFEDLRDQVELMDKYLRPFQPEITNPPDDLLGQAILLWRIFYFVADIYQRNHPEWILLLYEELAGNPLQSYQTLYQQLDLDWSHQIERKILAYSSTQNPVDTPETMDIKRDSKSLVNQWKKRLTAAEITEIKEKTADVWPIFYSEIDW
jgi:hypothetical protein